MVVQHNLAAMNSNRMLGVTSGKQAKSSEKLASGFRINRAADDAAGLSISEKMRKQINGLDQASTNAQDGVSAVQTAEGALTEVHSMLQRMNELAVQAANGTNSESDRDAIQAEIKELTTEIDRVAETTKFNETYLLKGNTDGATSMKEVPAHDAGLVGKLTYNGDGTATFALDKTLENGDTITIAGKEYTIGTPKTPNSYMTASTIDDVTLSVGDSVTHNGVTTTVTNDVPMSSLGSIATGNKIETADGSVYTKGTAGGAGTPNTGWFDVSGVEVEKTVADALIATEGNILTTTDGKSYEIVSALKPGEYSTFGVADADLTAAKIAGNGTAVTPGVGDFTVTVDGKTITAIDDNYPADTYSNVKDSIMALAAGNTVTLGAVDGTLIGGYTIVENPADEDPETNKYTRESIVDMIKEGYQVEYNGTKETVAGAETMVAGAITAQEAYKLIADELQAASSIGTDTPASIINNNDGTFKIKQGTVEVKDSLAFNIHVGTEADMSNKINIEIETMDSANLGIKNLNVSDNTGVAATYAIDAIGEAITKVSSQRSALGAIQNRLEHTIANLDNVVENTTAAESRIRDTDMAEEMVEYSKNNILVQAGQSMLAQANQATQGVLSLLQ